ncbi:MAG: hypothetical protein ACP5U2_02640, partial [Bryobacteraceae bacterium]
EAQPILRDVRVEGRSLTLALEIAGAQVERLLATFRAPAKTATTPAAPPEGGVTIYSSPSDMGVIQIPAPAAPK